jgi:hypothetical protein
LTSGSDGTRDDGALLLYRTWLGGEIDGFGRIMICTTSMGGRGGEVMGRYETKCRQGSMCVIFATEKGKMYTRLSKIGEDGDGEGMT